MDSDLHDAHSRVLAEMADALMYRRLCELVDAHRSWSPSAEAEPEEGPLEAVARHLHELEMRQAARAAQTVFGDRHDGLGPTIGMDLKAS